MNKLRLWFFKHFLCADTVDEEFNIWFNGMLGRELQDSGVFYAIAVKGRPGIPTIGHDWALYSKYEDAEYKKDILQSIQPQLKLEIRVVRNFYSEVK